MKFVKFDKTKDLKRGFYFVVEPVEMNDGHIYQYLSILYYYKGGDMRVGSKIRGKYTRSYPESNEVYDRLFFLESGFYECTKDLSYIYHDVTHYCPIPEDLILEGYEFSMNFLEIKCAAAIADELKFERIQSMKCINKEQK